MIIAFFLFFQKNNLKKLFNFCRFLGNKLDLKKNWYLNFSIFKRKIDLFSNSKKIDLKKKKFATN